MKGKVFNNFLALLRWQLQGAKRKEEVLPPPLPLQLQLTYPAQTTQPAQSTQPLPAQTTQPAQSGRGSWSSIPYTDEQVP